MRRQQVTLAESDHSDDDRVTSSDDTEQLMASTSTSASDLSSSDDEAGALKRLHWGWVVVASGFYCVAMVGGVSDKQ